MAVVLVHGNPETDAVWGPLVAELSRDDVVRLSPPGFGAPVPEGFGATAGEYVAWLVAELETIGEPVDLVGHDWGAGHVINVALTRPDLLRSWSSDGLGVFHPDYEWHDLAKAWRTPGVGEEAVAAMMGGGVAERAGQMTALGIPAEVAAEFAKSQGPEMGRCILALYRSADPSLLAEVGRLIPAAAARPGLQINATDDDFTGSAAMRRHMAEQAGARVEELPGLGHWWMLQDPAASAAALTRFWSSLPA